MLGFVGIAQSRERFTSAWAASNERAEWLWKGPNARISASSHGFVRGIPYEDEALVATI
jgi:hypothetical protein